MVTATDGPRRPYQILKRAGFRKIKNLKGGILAWGDQVDHTLPTY
jgi:rhodanese-related sulfurtransferase